ncbi:MAG: hypothetical protein M5U35_10685 [Roseovarius sp.]|nr:hypothetical protein [Roseovarius sp.]
MTMTVPAIMAIGLVLLTAGLVALPLFRPAANRALGRGVESRDPVDRWQVEKDRLTGQLRENDMALAEGRIDQAAHGLNNRHLAAEAETALEALRRARDAFDPVDGPQARMPGRIGSALTMLCVAAAAFGVSRAASWNDIDMTVSPHADGRIPIEAPSAAAPALPPDMPMTADGAPDIGAMVARLEARVRDGAATSDDYRMLLRSYGVLGREAEAPEVLAAAAEQYPDDLEFRMNYLRMVIETPDAPPAAELLDQVGAVLAAAPDLAEAHWYRALLNLRLARPDAARADLEWLAVRLAPEHPATARVRSMLEMIDITGGTTGGRP